MQESIEGRRQGASFWGPEAVAAKWGRPLTWGIFLGASGGSGKAGKGADKGATFWAASGASWERLRAPTRGNFLGGERR
jgi:hypothetical protein